MYLTVLASLLVMALSVNTNTMNVNAVDIGADDVGLSVECVIVVVGCDGTGSVGNSGDTIIGSNDRNNPTEPSPCGECFTNNLTPEEIETFEAISGPIEESCEQAAALTPEQLAQLLAGLENFLVNSVGVDQDRAQAVVDCLEEVFGRGA